MRSKKTVANWFLAPLDKGSPVVVHKETFSLRLGELLLLLARVNRALLSGRNGLVSVKSNFYVHTFYNRFYFAILILLNWCFGFHFVDHPDRSRRSSLLYIILKN